MADEIKQVLGFDATQAIEALTQLDTSFGQFNQSIQSNIRSLSAYNTEAGKTVAALIQIKTKADEAADSLIRLANIRLPPPPGQSPPPATNLPAGQNLLTGQAAAQAMAQLLGQTTAAANTATPALNNAAGAANNTAGAFNNAGRSTSGFALNLETLSRVIGTQVIVRALSAFRSAVEDSLQSFIDFNQKIAEIQTIAQGESIESLAAGVRKLSDEFNAPILDVAKAKYQVLSNGFQSAAESTQVLTAALKFAKVGISDVTSAADLISSALNAYGKSASEAETLSAKLFKTIELGRVVGSELANSFGRVAPVAKEIGASENEILAAFSSITIGGVKASEAATQIRAALTGLLKPSKDTQEALHQLGFETGEDLIKAKGFQGALQALIGTTDGSTTAVAKLFPNVRALNGVLRETGTGVDIFKEHLKEISETASATLNKTFQLRIESNGEKVASDFNKLSNFFTVDLGKSLTNTTAGFISMFGGIDNVISAMNRFVPIVGAAVAVLVGYNVGVLAVSAALKLYAAATTTAATTTTVLSTAMAGLVLVVAGVSAVNFAADAIVRAIEAPRKKAEEEAGQLLQFEKDQAEARISISENENKVKAGLIHDAVAEARKGSFDATDAAKEANKQLIEDDKATIDKIIAGRQKFANDIKRAAIQADNDVVDSRKRANDLQNQLDDRRFEVQNSRLNELQQSARQRQRAEELANEAANKLATASKPEEKEAAQAEFNRADAFAKEALQSAKTAGNRAAQVAAERTIEQILQRRIDAEKAFQKEREADAKKLADAAAAEEARITKLKDLGKDFLQKSSLFDKKGDLLPKDQLVKNLDEAKGLLAKFKEQAFGPGSKFNLSDLISFDRLEARLEQSFTKTEVKNLFAAPEALDKLFQQVQSVFKSRQILVQTAIDPSKLKGKNDQEGAREVDAQIDAQVEKVNALKRASEERKVAEDDIVHSLERAKSIAGEERTIVEDLAQGFGVLSRTTVGAGAKTVEAAQNLARERQEILKLLNDPGTTSKQVNDLAAKLKETSSQLPSTFQSEVNKASDLFKILTQVFEERQKISGLDKTGQTDAALQTQQQLLNAISSEQAVRKAAATAAAAEKTATEGTATAANSVSTATETAKSNTAAIASNLERAAAAAAQTAASSSQISSGGGTRTDALGGFVERFATGGFAKGTDTIAATLSPRETVINARQSERFHPQLVALNAGVTPSFSNTTNHGGTVNINGDININESKDGQASAKHIIDLIRRAQRRGSGNTFSSG